MLPSQMQPHESASGVLENMGCLNRYVSLELPLQIIPDALYIQSCAAVSSGVGVRRILPKQACVRMSSGRVRVDWGRGATYTEAAR